MSRWLLVLVAACTAADTVHDAPPPIDATAFVGCVGWMDEPAAGNNPMLCAPACADFTQLGSAAGATTGCSYSGGASPCQLRLMTANYNVPGAGCCVYKAVPEPHVDFKACTR